MTVIRYGIIGGLVGAAAGLGLWLLRRGDNSQPAAVPSEPEPIIPPEPATPRAMAFSSAWRSSPRPAARRSWPKA